LGLGFRLVGTGPPSLGLACARRAAVGLPDQPTSCATQLRHPFLGGRIPVPATSATTTSRPLFHAGALDRGDWSPTRTSRSSYPVLIGTFMYLGRPGLLAFLTHVGAGGPATTTPSYFEITGPAVVAVLLRGDAFFLRPRVTAGRLMLWAIGTPTIFYTLPQLGTSSPSPR